jgi:hypothetical protein
MNSVPGIAEVGQGRGQRAESCERFELIHKARYFVLFFNWHL